MLFCGIDIGGTKCAVSLGQIKEDGDFEILQKEKFATLSPYETLERFAEILENLLCGRKLCAIGISCGGPLDSKTGVIMSPPNLPGWDNIPAVDFFKKRFNVPTVIQNDANACCFAEYKFGAGKGYSNVIFLTFGTGLGAGLILDGRLYSGTNDNAGECGHIRLEKDGPVGYGKAGSFEGFCSGGGIAALGKSMTLEKLRKGEKVAFCESENDLDNINAKVIADYADAGDEFAKSIYALSGHYLGVGLSVLIDILNPEVIIIGSIFSRSKNLLWDECKKVIDKEALPGSASVCKVVTSGLGEKIGDYAALSLAVKAYEEENNIQ